MSLSIPDLVDNGKYKLADVLRAALAQSQDPRLDVVTAFFNLKGLEALEPEVHALARLRLLLGKEQEQAFVVGERLLAELEDAAARGEVTAGEIERWRNFLARDTVEVRRYAKAFLHGKAYIVHGVPTLGAVGIVGSSNFTGAGLTTNLELNAVLKQTSAVNELQAWFDFLWTEAEDYKTGLLELLERFTRTYTPYEIYMKVIYEALRDKLEQELCEKDEKPSPIALANFQHDGYLAAREILENYGGVLIADSVGLGKTFLTLRLLEDYSYRERQTALIVCPAAVENTIWRPWLRQFAIPHVIVSMERMSRRDFPVDEYARRFRVIVVDESHNFRNPDTNRWPNLFRIITQGTPDKKILLLTATPVNNTVFDLYHQLRLITRDNRRLLLSAGIPDLWEYFRRAEQNRDALYEVLEALAVRRSRQFIRQNYPEAEIDGQKIMFPERELHTVHYSLKATYGAELYRKTADAIENLLLAPYQVDTYRRELMEARRTQVKQLSLFEMPEETSEGAVKRLQEALGWSREEAHEFLMTVGRQTALAHIMRVLYLKRLESSVESLRISLHRLHRFLKFFLHALKEGRLLSSKEYRQWLQMEGSDEEGIEGGTEAFFASLPELPVERYDIESIRAAAEADLHTLESTLTELEQDRPDDKMETLKELLSSPSLQGRKVIVFSYFKDTARYLYQQLLSDPSFLAKLGHRRIAIVDSGVKPSERNARIIRFAPMANRRPDIPQEDQVDLLISTDVLSEGQNLQDAEIIVNYDLHWNPVRMVQRVGRVDRIGSPHKVIHVYNFFPEEELEDLLGLLGRLHYKLEAINRTVGLDASVLQAFDSDGDMSRGSGT
jgi:SNF2 family DNA or RNA helicase